MQYQIFLTIASAAYLAAAVPHNEHHLEFEAGTPVTSAVHAEMSTMPVTGSNCSMDSNTTDTTLLGENLQHWGVLIFDSFEILDIMGPLSPLNVLSLNNTMQLHFIAETMDPVTTAVTRMNRAGSIWNQTIYPTHTFQTAPPLDVLFVPGGPGTRASAEETLTLTNFIADRIDEVKYLFTVCTGAGLAARSGVLDGHRATGNKAAWQWVTAQGPNVNWESHARWVEDGKLWSTSGVTAGIDGMIAFISSKFGEPLADRLSTLLEHTRWTNASYDPFADHYNLP